MIELHHASVRPVQLLPSDLAGATNPDRSTGTDPDESAFAQILDTQLAQDRLATAEQGPHGSTLQGDERLAGADAASHGPHTTAQDSAPGPVTSDLAATAKAAVEDSTIPGPLAQLIEAIERLTDGARSLALREGGQAAQASAGLEGLLARLREARDLSELDLGGLLTTLGRAGRGTADTAALGSLLQQARSALTGALGSEREAGTSALARGDGGSAADAARATSTQGAREETHVASRFLQHSSLSPFLPTFRRPTQDFKSVKNSKIPN